MTPPSDLGLSPATDHDSRGAADRAGAARRRVGTASLTDQRQQRDAPLTFSQALSDFSDYVASVQQQRSRLNTQPGATNGPAKTEHAELDILDTLDLADDKPKVRLKPLLLDAGDTKDESIKQLREIIDGRLEDGHGECLFDIGLEDNGDGQALTEQEWTASLARLDEVMAKLKADYRMLMTKNVPDSAVNVGNEAKKEKGCVGKVIIRRRPGDVDDTIETRIAVVGNVDAGKSTLLGVLVKGGLDMASVYLTLGWRTMETARR
nr:gtp-binding protein 2 [Quercus suber]